jgi:uncharacterized DUF497 family protein
MKQYNLFDSSFEWDYDKDRLNQRKHDVSFVWAQEAFFDKHVVFAQDLKHSEHEQRYFCFGKVFNRVLTVRFVYRNRKIRIIGAGYWRRGKKAYEEKNKIYR